MNTRGVLQGALDERFVIEHSVGEGASGIVYKATNLRDHQAVALKLFHHRDENEEQLVLEERPSLALAQSEFQVLGYINHPGVVSAVDVGWLHDGHSAYLATEWIEGLELHRHHQVTPFSIREIMGLGVLLCRALSAVHDCGVVHQDIKPANILMQARTPDSDILPQLVVEPVLIDFGIAALGPRNRPRGTPAYMSPEQARGGDTLDHRSDLYSLGATLFELLVGRPPHQGANPLATLARLATTPAPRVSSFRADVSSRVDDLIDQLLQTDPSRRPATAMEAEALFCKCLHETPESNRPAEVSSRLGVGATRLVTTVVAMNLSEAAMKAARDEVSGRGAEAVQLGDRAVVAHLGVEHATGGEANAALNLGQILAASGASVGIASGRARLGEAYGGGVRPVGEVVDRAANLAREATIGQILSDATTTELGRGAFEFKMRTDGSAIVGDRLDGFALQRGGAPFVGRDAELAQVLSAYERAETDHHPMIVSLSGPPGIGKSRLQRECIARISSRAEAPRVIVHKSGAYARRQTLGAAADILRRLLELPQSAAPEEIQDAIVDRLGPDTMNDLTEENRALLSGLLSGRTFPEKVDPVAARDALWLTMTELVTRVLSNEPVVLVTEDLQWADPESVVWIDHLLGRSSRHTLFIISCVRPAFWETEGERYKQRDHLRIDLRPISNHSVRMIAESVLGAQAPTVDIESLSLRAGGSPLFAEELARLAASGKGSNAPTIEAAIEASLDALDPVSRQALSHLSVLGLSCWDLALDALFGSDARDVLKTLVASELLIEQSTSRFKDAKEYAFKHALVRDVAYQSLGPELRVELHAQAGRWLAAMGEDAALVAGHLDLGHERELSAQYWETAAVRALAANALQDGVTMAERALDFAQNPEEQFRRASLLDGAYSRLDPRAADRESAITAMEAAAFDAASQVRSQGARARYDDARGTGTDLVQRLSTARDNAQRLGLIDEVARCSATLATRFAFLGNFDEAEREVETLLALNVHRSLGTRVDAYQTLAIIRQTRGAVSSSLDARKSAVTAARDAGLKEREAMLTTNLGFALSTVGARKEAREALERGLILAENIASPAATRHAQMNLLGWAAMYGSDRRLDTFLGETRAEADAAATGYWAAPDRSNLGMLFYRGVELLRSTSEGNRRRALILLNKSADSYKATGNRDVLPVALGMWAEAERVCGNSQRAAQIAGEGATLLSQGAHSLLNEGPIFLTLHKAQLDLGNEDLARAALADGIRLLLRRVNGLVGSPYVTTFLTQLSSNAELIAAADASGLLPEAIQSLLVNQA